MTTNTPLKGWTIAVPESRQLDLFSEMLELRGATTLRCPLVSIYDSPNEAAMKAWLTEFTTGDFDDFIVLTGEGLKRITGFAQRFGMEEQWLTALAKVRKVVRGPKPGRVLKSYKLKPDVLAVESTTDGIIKTLEPEDLTGRKIAVQLYGEDPNHKLQEFLSKKKANVSLVAPYVYAPDCENEQVVDVIKQIVNNDIHAMVFTSMQQVPRLLKLANKIEEKTSLIESLNNIVVAAVGPVVADKLEENGIKVTLMPESKFFMKPLVRELVKHAESVG